MIPTLNWPEVIGHLEAVGILPVHVYANGTLWPLADLRRCGTRICAQAGSYEHSALTTDATATLWRAVEQMATGSLTPRAFGLIDELIAPMTGMWVLRPDDGCATRIVALTCAVPATQASTQSSMRFLYPQEQGRRYA